MGEKKRRLAAGVAEASRGGEFIARALSALDRGDRAAAEADLSRLLSAPPAQPEALDRAAYLALRLGRPADAERLLMRAIDAQPGQSRFRCNLAMVYRQGGQFSRAIDHLTAFIAQQPRDAPSRASLGYALLDAGRVEDAASSFERAVSIAPNFPDALLGLGISQMRAGRYAQAVASLERAISIAPGLHAAHAGLAETRHRMAVLQSGQGDDRARARETLALSLAAVSEALRLAPGEIAYWNQLADILRFQRLTHPLGESARALLLSALANPALDPSDFAPAIAGLACTHPAAIRLNIGAAGPAAAANRPGDFDPAPWAAAKPLLAEVFAEPLLQRLLACAVVPDPFVERMLVIARRGALSELAGPPSLEAPFPLPVLSAIALQCFATEYVYEETHEERAALQAVRAALVSLRSAGAQVPHHWYAVYGCYRPLADLEGAEAIAAELGATPLATLAARQVLEPLEELRLRSAIAPLTGASGGVSQAVQAQYESNPYPRWQHVPENPAPRSLAGVVRSLFPGVDTEGIPDGPVRILVAGCGTGRHAIRTARRFRESRVLAVDLSLASLAYALRKTRALGVPGIEYRQADILGLAPCAERFDLVECVGVLHHLEDPLAGWRVLRSLLLARGLMRIGLYSELARRPVALAREFIDSRGFAPTPEDIRRCREEFLSRTGDDRFAAFAGAEDFYSMSGCRDLVFHARESRFTLPQIGGMLDTLGLAFMGMEIVDARMAARFDAMFPGPAARRDLGSWQGFESAWPDAFAEMYLFWARAKD